MRGRNFPNVIYYLSNTNIVRASERQHPIQGRSSHGNFGCLGLVGARSEGIADYPLVSAYRCLDLGSKIVPAGFLPRHAAPFGGHPQVTVALCRGVLAEALTTAPARGGTMTAASG